jgi:fructose-bisphosphate aldolase, class II
MITYRDRLVGNPDGPEKPNKKYYDPRECLRAAEVNTVKRLEQSFADLKCQNILGLGEVSAALNVLGPRRGGLPV